MNIEKVNLIIKNMELLVHSLKEEVKDFDGANIIKLEDLFTPQELIDEYEPDYYEEED